MCIMIHIISRSYTYQIYTTQYVVCMLAMFPGLYICVILHQTLLSRVHNKRILLIQKFTILTNHGNVPFMRNMWQEKMLVNHTGKSYWCGKIWRISYSQCICQIHFCVSMNIGEANSSQFTKIFPHQIFPVYGI